MSGGGASERKDSVVVLWKVCGKKDLIKLEDCRERDVEGLEENG
jgi:hypothetical protein